VPSVPRVWLRLTGGVVLLAALMAVSVPSNPRIRLCPFYWMTGRPCPLCGLTRGLFALAKGNWGDALHFNALTPLAFVMIFSLFWDRPWRAHLWTAGLAAFAVYGIYRVALA
jgi:hypothetical protein